MFQTDDLGNGRLSIAWPGYSLTHQSYWDHLHLLLHSNNSSLLRSFTNVTSNATIQLTAGYQYNLTSWTSSYGVNSSIKSFQLPTMCKWRNGPVVTSTLSQAPIPMMS